jgi:hypothetical protein
MCMILHNQGNPSQICKIPVNITMNINCCKINKGVSKKDRNEYSHLGMSSKENYMVNN